jgi:hypothetical protein
LKYRTANGLEQEVLSSIQNAFMAEESTARHIIYSSDADLSSRSQVLTIQASQKDWPASKKHCTSSFCEFYTGQSF